MASGISANKLELLQIADAVAREKGIEMDIVLSAMADAIKKRRKRAMGRKTIFASILTRKPARPNCCAW